MNLIDHINMSNPLVVAQSTFAIASGMQDHHPSDQVLAAAVFTLVMAEEFRLDPRDVLLKAHSLMKDTDQFNQRQIAAIRQLIREEYMK